MGWLHDGHRSLMQRARAENATTIATIFVNPRQFNEAADYQRYPRNEARDLAIVEEEGIDLVFAPPVEEIYLPGFDTTVSVGRGRWPVGGRRAAGPLRRRRDRRGDPLRARRGGPRVLRAEGRPAGDGHPPDGPRPRDPDRGHRLSDGTGAGRARALLAERPPLGGGAGRGPRAPPGVACRPRSLGCW